MNHIVNWAAAVGWTVIVVFIATIAGASPVVTTGGGIGALIGGLAGGYLYDLTH